MICPVCHKTVKLFNMTKSMLFACDYNHFKIYIDEDDIMLVAIVGKYKIIINSCRYNCCIIFNNKTIRIPKFYLDISSDLFQQIQNVLLLS